MSSPSPTPSNESEESVEQPRPQLSAGLEQDQEKKVEETPANRDAQTVSTSQTAPSSAGLSAGPWQAIFAPQYNAYYFHNATTGETTWVNPLQSSDPSPSGGAPDMGANAEADGLDGTANPNPYDPHSLEARAIAAGIDPSLAYLDPSLAGPSSLAPAGTFTAKFNARTGAFTAADGRAPSHLSEYERMKRMNSFYFDMGAWERDVEQRDEEEKATGGKKRKRPTKKDLERFKEQKRLKKIAKTAWLRT